MLTKEQRVTKAEELKRKMLTECKKCDGGYTENGACFCLKQYRSVAVGILAGIPEQYLAYQVATYPGDTELAKDRRIKRVLDWMLKYEKHMKENVEHNIGLLVMGPYGTGKTGLLCSVMMTALRFLWPDNNGYYTPATEMLLAVGAGKYDYRAPVYQMSDFVTCGVLLIDDLGKEFTIGTAGVVADRHKFGMILDEVLRTRVSKGLLTMMSTNYSLDQIGEEYGASCLEAVKLGMNPIAFGSDFPNLRDNSAETAAKKAGELYEND